MRLLSSETVAGIKSCTLLTILGTPSTVRDRAPLLLLLLDILLLSIYVPTLLLPPPSSPPWTVGWVR
jgi:hypothetical protein